MIPLTAFYFVFSSVKLAALNPVNAVDWPDFYVIRPVVCITAVVRLAIWIFITVRKLDVPFAEWREITQISSCYKKGIIIALFNYATYVVEILLKT